MESKKTKEIEYGPEERDECMEGDARLDSPDRPNSNWPANYMHGQWSPNGVSPS